MQEGPAGADWSRGYQDALTPGSDFDSSGGEEYARGYGEGMKFYMPH